MKFLFVFILYVTYGGLLQQDFFEPNKPYVLKLVKGSEHDRNMIFYYNKGEKLIDSSMTLKYYETDHFIRIVSDTTLMASFHVEAKTGHFYINNYLPFREILSFKDKNERNYHLEIRKAKKNQLKLIISNYGKANMLDKQVEILLELQ